LVKAFEWKTLGVKIPDQVAVRVSPPRAGLLPDVFRRKLMRAQSNISNENLRRVFRAEELERISAPALKIGDADGIIAYHRNLTRCAARAPPFRGGEV
jgi:hypothetical protein